MRACKITDNMAIAAAHSLASYAEKRGITPEDIVPKMDEADVFAYEAADVAMQAIADGVAGIKLSRKEVFEKVKTEINSTRALCHNLMEGGFISSPPAELINKALESTITQFNRK